MLDFLDPEKQTIKYRLYREHCTKVGNLYIKDLNRLGRDLVESRCLDKAQKRTVIIDNSIVSFAYHLSNGIPIRSWYDDWEDREVGVIVWIHCSCTVLRKSCTDYKR